MTIHPIVPTPDLRSQLIIHLRSSEGSGTSWAAEALNASYVAVEDALDAMVEDGLAFKDGSYEPAVYLLRRRLQPILKSDSHACRIPPTRSVFGTGSWTFSIRPRWFRSSHGPHAIARLRRHRKGAIASGHHQGPPAQFLGQGSRFRQHLHAEDDGLGGGELEAPHQAQGIPGALIRAR